MYSLLSCRIGGVVWEILDVLVEFNGSSRINIELQIKMLSKWDGHSVFYLSKLFSEGLLRAQTYKKLKRCVYQHSGL